MDTKQVLIEREKTHGDFKVHSMVSQSLKDCLWVQNGWCRLNLMQREAVEMICHKIARVVAGDPHHADHWRDISGYATLIADCLEERP